MLKAFSSSLLQHRFQRIPAGFSGHEGGRNTPLFRILGSLRSSNGGNSVLCKRVFFCSESGDGSDPVEDAKPAVEVESAANENAEEVDSKASSAIVPTNPRPEDYLKVRVLAFWGFCVINFSRFIAFEIVCLLLLMGVLYLMIIYTSSFVCLKFIVLGIAFVY